MSNYRIKEEIYQDGEKRFTPQWFDGSVNMDMWLNLTEPKSTYKLALEVINIDKRMKKPLFEVIIHEIN